MILDAATANESEAAGAMNLALSLLSSRLSWLTQAFTPISTLDSERPKTLLDTVEVQIGPHVFIDTKFYRIVESPPLLAFEFAEHPGVLFGLPKGLSIDPARSRGETTCMRFYAAPTQPLKREPCIIRQDWPDYNMAERTFTCIDIAIQGANDALRGMLSTHSAAHSTAVWQQYGEAAWNRRPAVKYWQSFFPLQHQAQYPSAPQHTPAPAREEAPADTSSSRQKSPTPALEERLQPSTEAKEGGQGKPDQEAPAPESKDSSNSGHESEEEEEEEEEEESAAPSSSGKSQASASDVEVAIFQTAQSASSPGPYETPVERSMKRPASATSSAKLKSRKTTADLPATRGRKCRYCGCNETPMWRRGPDGTGTLCNACGVKWKHGKILQE